MYCKTATFFVVTAIISASAHAGITVWATDDDQGVAMAAANVLASKGAMQRGTCVDHYSAPHQCTKNVNEGKTYACPAGFSKYKSSCKGKPSAIQSFNEAVESLKNMDKCYKREEECGKAAGIALKAAAN